MSNGNETKVKEDPLLNESIMTEDGCDAREVETRLLARMKDYEDVVASLRDQLGIVADAMVKLQLHLTSHSVQQTQTPLASTTASSSSVSTTSSASVTSNSTITTSVSSPADLAFLESKQALANATLLSHPQENAKLRLVTDASTIAAGAALEQETATGWKPLAFFSKKFTSVIAEPTFRPSAPSEPPGTIFVQLHRDFPKKVIAEPEFRPSVSSEPPGTISVRLQLDFSKNVIAEPEFRPSAPSEPPGTIYVRKHLRLPGESHRRALFDLVGQAGLQDSTRSIRYMYSVHEASEQQHNRRACKQNNDQRSRIATSTADKPASRTTISRAAPIDGATATSVTASTHAALYNFKIRSREQSATMRLVQSSMRKN
ncbi:unnamed protein product [Trichogramma brassicae]|uniref:Reverse transcriptase/retrotransposon-derived protein RNase H-like domain-containing protein n=1 Tax=Trichogramma brassicae TaxID=86971 RepID=A0A6H5IYL8_9HYME|nr:unnamed protein product [Trichogramma brassicae]